MRPCIIDELSLRKKWCKYLSMKQVREACAKANNKDQKDDNCEMIMWYLRC